MTGFLESEEALHAAARDACGLEDFGDDAYLEGLRALLESLEFGGQGVALAVER